MPWYTNTNENTDTTTNTQIYVYVPQIHKIHSLAEKSKLYCIFIKIQIQMKIQNNWIYKLHHCSDCYAKVEIMLPS